MSLKFRHLIVLVLWIFYRIKIVQYQKNLGTTGIDILDFFKHIIFQIWGTCDEVSFFHICLKQKYIPDIRDINIVLIYLISATA